MLEFSVFTVYFGPINILKARSDNIVNCKLSTLHTLVSAMNVSIKELFDYVDEKKTKA
jgi:hypothetical protein